MERWPLATAPFRLRAVLLGLALAGALSGNPPTPAAAADDFTGFYAGVNAGYGWSKERQADTPGGGKPGTPLPAWGKLQGADGLPPSAARAADRNPALSGARSGAR